MIKDILKALLKMICIVSALFITIFTVVFIYDPMIGIGIISFIGGFLIYFSGNDEEKKK